MTMINPNADRREFLKRSSMLSIAGAASPWAMNLAAIGEAAAQSATDYKALVCIFLFGGNDYANTIIPYDATNYNKYFSLRGATLSIPQANLAATALTPLAAAMGGTDLSTRQYALAPNLSPLLPIFNDEKLAVLLNAGTLIQPTTKAQYTAKSVPLPAKLLSHNDQQSVWQSSAAEGATTGWGGRIGDLFASGNGNSTFSCISVSGNAVYLSGSSAVQYQVSTNGSVALNALKTPMFGSTTIANTLKSMITAPSNQLFQSEHARIAKRAVDANDQLTAALAVTANKLPADALFMSPTFDTSNSLATQLKMVAQLIASRNTLSAKRQVFFVSLGGFDTHDNLTTDHPVLMTKVSNAMAMFDDAMRKIGTHNFVTSFTASDFGRTLTGNGDGSDHGWGSHHMIMGGAVKGKRFYGTPPEVANNGADDIGQGRLVPTTSVDQLAGTLATWFGVSNTDMKVVLPNLGNFSSGNLGFL
jgi:uncharacterized protein (DUF1501 family)